MIPRPAHFVLLLSPILPRTPASFLPSIYISEPPEQSCGLFSNCPVLPEILLPDQISHLHAWPQGSVTWTVSFFLAGEPSHMALPTWTCSAALRSDQLKTKYPRHQLSKCLSRPGYFTLPATIFLQLLLDIQETCEVGSVSAAPKESDHIPRPHSIFSELCLLVGSWCLRVEPYLEHHFSWELGCYSPALKLLVLICFNNIFLL